MSHRVANAKIIGPSQPLVPRIHAIDLQFNEFYWKILRKIKSKFGSIRSSLQKTDDETGEVKVTEWLTSKQIEYHLFIEHCSPALNDHPEIPLA